jgi:phosphoserine phosphatase RsbU/P
MPLHLKWLSTPCGSSTTEPLRLLVPVMLGLKNVKAVTKMTYTAGKPRTAGLREDTRAMTESSWHVMNRTTKRLACLEVWGGNRTADQAVELPGLSGWVHSSPLDPTLAGGDVYYFSVCSHGTLSRVALADVAGHGSSASSTAEGLRSILREHIDSWDQSMLMSELNDAFESRSETSRYATAAVLGFQSETGELLFSNAGHPPPFWYRAREKSWYWLRDRTPFAAGVEGLPLGMIPGTAYSQTGARLGVGDVVLLYTDGITEATDPSNSELGYEGLLQMVEQVAGESPDEMVQDLISRIQSFRANAPRQDDDTLILLQRVSTGAISTKP